MASGLNGNVSSDPMQVALASLADAADVFAKAATALAEAALTVAGLSREVQQPESPVESHGINLGRGSDAASDLASRDMDGSGEVEGTDIDGGDQGGERSLSATGPDSEEAVPYPMSTDTTEQESSQINPPYCLLVDSEADVLLLVCALINKRQKVVCYMPCGTPPLKTYKQLLENVTESPIYILNSAASLGQDQSYLNFVESSGSVLLIPETLLPQFEIEGENSWVIHVGWPASESQYTAQRKTHQSRNNILVACSSDQWLYHSGDSILNLTEPWPGSGAAFDASVSILRPLYESILSEIPLELKAQVYMDWIQFHGIHGPRRVESWSPITVVQRANDYLLKVMQWSGEHTGGNNIPLPEVSRGFVIQNSLESAVQEGILLVEDDSDDSDSPEVRRSPTPRSESVLTQTEFQPTSGHTYFTLEEEFDIIPLICFISEKYDKVICFLEGQGALRSYQQLFANITGRHAISPAVINDAQAVEEAVVQFLSTLQPAILLLAYNTTNLPAVLKEGSIDCCLYWGFNVPLRHVKKNRSLINCETTILIMTTTQRRGMKFPNDTRKHPSSAIPLDLTENSILAPTRIKTHSVLTSAKGKRVVKALYTNRVYSLGGIPRSSVSAEDVAHRANQYAARFLLHGEIADGSGVFPPVGERPSVPKKTVEKFDLEPAVEAGLLTIGK